MASAGEGGQDPSGQDPSGQDPSGRLRELEAMIGAIRNFEIIKLDIHGNIASWSAGARTLKGYAAEEILGQPVSIFYTEEDRNAGVAERELQAAVAHGRVAFEAWRLRKGGGRFWASVTLAPIRDSSGQLTGFVKVTRDLTQRREHEQRLQRQRNEIVELSTPVLEIWAKVLLLPIIGTIDSGRAARLTNDVLRKIAETGSEVVILDISGVPIIDSHVGRHLVQTVDAAGLMGTMSILSGVRAEVAQAVVNLGVDLGRIRSRTTLREALQLALQLTNAR